MTKSRYINNRIKSIAIIVAIFFSGSLWAQIELSIDRTLYATGEDILFSAHLRQSPDTEIPWSSVIYLSLVSPDGTPVARGKYSVSSYSSHGYLHVPDHILTGNYYLIAYTRWMQNFSPSNYTFRHIRIINPHSNELEPSCLQENYDLPFKQKSEEKGIGEIIDCFTKSTCYKKGEKVEISICLPDNVTASVSSFTAVAGSPEVIDSMLLTSVQPDSIWYQPSETIRYFPELMGISLSGKVFLKDSGKPAGNTRVELTILDNELSFRTNLTNEDGFFIMALDSMTGAKEMFIAAKSTESDNLEIRVDNDFAFKNFNFSPRPFSLTQSEKEVATRITHIAQIRNSFQNGKPGKAGSEDTGKEYFYGVPSSLIMIDDFIKLPTLDEVFIELFPWVQPVTRNKKRSLVFHKNLDNRYLIGSYDPLILLDKVPVYDQEKILALYPQKLHSIEVVNKSYQLGNIIYEGIVNITSRNNDMAGLDLPVGSFFFDFDTFLPQPGLEDLISSSWSGTKIAEVFTNTILWEPELKLVPGKESKLTLTAPDRPGRYLILVRGLSGEGEIIQGRTSFMVE